MPSAVYLLPLLFACGLSQPAAEPAIRLIVTPLTGTYILIDWMVDRDINTTLSNNIQSFLIQIFDVHIQQDPEETFPEFTIVVPGNFTYYIFGSIGDGTEVTTATVSIQVNDVIDQEVGFLDGVTTTSVTLFTCFNLFCNFPIGRWDRTCSFCECINDAFSGPSCEDPEFFPRSVSVWPTSASTLLVTWTLNETQYESDLAEFGLRISHFQINIVSSSITKEIPMIPLSQRSHTVMNAEEGVEYSITVSTVAEGDDSVVVGSAPSVRTLIDPALFLEDSPTTTSSVSDSPSSSREFSTTEIGITVGVAVGSAIIVGCAGVCLTLLCVKKVITGRKGRPHKWSTRLNHNPAYAPGHGLQNSTMSLLRDIDSTASTPALWNGISTFSTQSTVLHTEDGTGGSEPQYDYISADF